MPIWKQRLQRSLHLGRSKPESKYVQLATIDTSGMPAVRTVVFRGFVEQNNHLIAVTDRRSDKYQELLLCNKAQLCWYFAKTREQYRLSCEVKMHLDGHIVTEYWNKLSANAQSSFSEPCPKVPLSESGLSENTEETSNTEVAPINQNFVVLEFCPTNSDYLNLKEKPQQRVLETYSAESYQWHEIYVNA